LEKVFGKPLGEAFSFENGASGPMTIEREGRRLSLDCKESIVKDLEGNVLGTAFVLKETNA